jgi:hypothetical protein
MKKQLSSKPNRSRVVEQTRVVEAMIAL